MTRRQWWRKVVVVGFGVSILGNTGCENKRTQNAAGQGAAAVGGLVFLIPHPIAKVIGVLLIAGGAALSIEATYEDGRTETINVQLTADQKQRVEKGAEVYLKDSRGKLIPRKPTNK